MPKDKLKKYGNIDIPVQSLQPPDKDGYITKRGGSVGTWHKRYMVLKDKTLYYYKTPKDSVITGKIDLEPTSISKEDPTSKKSSLMFTISTAKRIYYMFPDKADEVKSWVEAINKAVEKAKPVMTVQVERAGPSQTQYTSPVVTNTQPKTQPKVESYPSNNGEVKPPRVKLALAKHQVSFLKDEDSKVLEFWQIWAESIPAKEDITAGMSIEFTVSTSADMQKLTWRTAGPQNLFIQKMVDFFWNVGAPESEIDRLNDVGALINPVRIGSWIDMSGKGGMDGGWFFPVEIPLKHAVEAADTGEAVKKFANWAESHDITSIYAVGRDMGAAPPRQTELRLRLPGDNAEAQIALGIRAFAAFDFPPIPDDVLKIIRGSTYPEGCNLSVITSSEGFVRLGLMVPKPKTDTVLALLEIAGGNKNELALFEGSLHSAGPSYVEFQYLQRGFGYGVYKEGFDIVFHYDVGDETSD